MKLILMEADLWSTVEPGEDEPAEKQEIKLYLTRQRKALAKICLSVGELQQQHIQHLNSPRDVWQELIKLYAPRDCKHRIIKLRRTLYTLRFDDFNCMETYLGKINSIVIQLREAGDALDDVDISMCMLCGLPEEWDHIVSMISNLPEENFRSNIVKRKLLAEFSRSTDQGKIQNLTVNRSVRNAHIPTNIENRRNKEIICFKCKGKNHIARNCTLRDQNDSKKDSNFTLAITCLVAEQKQNHWIIDSGATHHMSPHQQIFSTLRTYGSRDQKEIKTAGGDKLQSMGCGNVEIQTRGPDGTLQNTILRDVIYVPNMKYNVLSVYQMCLRGIKGAIVYSQYSMVHYLRG